MRSNNMMKLTKILGMGGLAFALTTMGIGQVPPDEFDFTHVPLHTVEIKASSISGRPDSMRLRGYYLFRDGNNFVLLSHRPDSDGNTFMGSAFVDGGHFDSPGIVDRNSTDVADTTPHHLHWALQTHWRRVNGVTFAVEGESKYIVFNLNDDVKQGDRVPALFLGHDAHKFQSGSGYVLIDLLQ
jgi:hypothetical protein